MRYDTYGLTQRTYIQVYTNDTNIDFMSPTVHVFVNHHQ
jgi:hypothetical protein